MTYHGTIATDIVAEASKLRDRARFFVTKRRSDVELYRVLADCLSLCEECTRSGGGEELCAAVVNRPDGRRYFEADPDIYLIVGRYVFEGEKRRDAAWRYTAVMREAAKMQISGANLAAWLSENGGLNALFRARDVTARTSATRTLHLNQQVTVPKDGEFTLTLRMDRRGFFDVVKS